MQRCPETPVNGVPGHHTGWQVQCAGSGHRNGVSHDIGIACRGSSEWSGLDRLGHVTERHTSLGHHRSACRIQPVRSSSHLRRLPRLDQPADDSLQNRGRGSFRAPLPGSQNLPERHRVPDRRPGPRASQEALRGRSGRRRGHPRVASPTSPPDRAGPGHESTGSWSGPVPSSRTPPSDPSPPTSASKQPSPTRPGNRTSPTTDSQAAPMPRS